MTRPQSYRQRLRQFARSYVVMDLRDPIETRLARATAYERRYKTAGRPSRYATGYVVGYEPCRPSPNDRWIRSDVTSIWNGTRWLNVPD